MKRFKKFLIIFLLFSIYVSISIFSYSKTVSDNISNSVFRLHIIANSDSEQDQNLKFAVRDNLISYMNSICTDVSSKDEAIKVATEHLENLKKVAQDVIQENGFDYNVALEIGNFDFPTKNYGDIHLPAGFYDALKVKIGNASGKNWWCVLFPSLCFVDISDGILPQESKKDIQNSLDNEEYELISSESPKYKLKFKVVELFENAKITLAKK